MLFQIELKCRLENVNQIVIVFATFVDRLFFKKVRLIADSLKSVYLHYFVSSSANQGKKEVPYLNRFTPVVNRRFTYSYHLVRQCYGENLVIMKMTFTFFTKTRRKRFFFTIFSG